MPTTECLGAATRKISPEIFPHPHGRIFKDSSHSWVLPKQAAEQNQTVSQGFSNQ
jgi:hypothetical protein